MFSKKTNLPYYAVIFTSINFVRNDGYKETAELMFDLANKQGGFLGYESARENIGITISYWSDLKSIKKWKSNAFHLIAQKKGRKLWYKSYNVRICEVKENYSFENI